MPTRCSSLDIYAASETPIEGVTGEALAQNIREGESSSSYVRSFEDAISSVEATLNPGDMILTLGAGSVYSLDR